MESDSGFCIWWETNRERQREVAVDGRQPEPQVWSQAPLRSTPWASGSNLCPQPLPLYSTHLLQEDRELQAELLLKLGVPREERHIHHHLPGSR